MTGSTYSWEVRSLWRLLRVVWYCYRNHVEFEYEPFPEWPAGEFPMVRVPEEHSDTIARILDPSYRPTPEHVLQKIREDIEKRLAK